jgi:two-component system chemotaxis sensor kinase CheA
MNPIDTSMEPMLEMFIFETTTLLEQLDEIMIASEKSGRFGPGDVDEIFRIMHTIKGSSAMMGLEGMSELAHHVEDMFFLIRENPGQMLADGEAVFDLIFQATDYFKRGIEGVAAGSVYSADHSCLSEGIAAEVSRLKGEHPVKGAFTACLSSSQVSAITSSSTARSAGNKAASKTLYIKVFFEDGCQMENIRAFMLLSQLKDLCESLDSVPSHPEQDSGLSAEIIKNGFLIRLTTDNPINDLLAVIENAINIRSYELLDEQPVELTAGTHVRHTSAEENDQTLKFEENFSQLAAAAAGKSGKQSLISVNQQKLDQLMDVVGEIVIAESMVASNPELKGMKLDNFYKSTRQLRKLTDELQDIVMSIRMVPLSGVFQKMNRIVRDMSKKLNKEVTFETFGGETEVDKSITDVIADPFMHMIRNAMDHAIETPEERRRLRKPEIGKITMSAQNIGGEIVITISDDGRGLNTEQILRKAREKGLLTKAESEYSLKEIHALIMLPGFSTNDKVTEYSGRGVGMDVVKKNLEKVGGAVLVESKLNVGTDFIIKIPLTLAIVDGMEIQSGDTVFTLPITSIKESFKLSSNNQLIQDTNGHEMIMVRGECYSLIRLHRIYDIPGAKTELSEGIMVLIENDLKAACLFADELIGEQQVVVKPFPIFLNKYNVKEDGLAGCTILGDGSISLILDANNLLLKY